MTRAYAYDARSRENASTLELPACGLEMPAHRPARNACALWS
jgi:hypothetical protein